MGRLMFAAMHSGGGKTAVTCAFLAALKNRGLSPRAFKCGPDYIDPMFHRQVLGVPSRNLDLFLSTEDTVRGLLCAHSNGEFSVLEGVMGLFDGLGGTDRDSSWHLAAATDTPVVLVLRSKGASLTLAAQVRGLMDFRPGNPIRGLFLTDCGENLHAHLSPLLERETGLPVLGYLPHMEAAAFPSRHLGLLTAEELSDWRQRANELGVQMERTGGMDGFLKLAGKAPALTGVLPAVEPIDGTPVIAVARDRAFCFCYEDNLDLLERLGARLAFFSPMEDTELPAGSSALYLPGGYPELYAKALSENTQMRKAIRQAVENGMPTVAECGGFLYLQRSLEDSEGEAWPMCGVLPGEGFKTPRLQRFGYGELTTRCDSLLLKAGEALPVHEFHYWDSTDNGRSLTMTKASAGQSWPCCFAGKSLFAGFPHLYFYANPAIARRFVQAAADYAKEHSYDA